MVVFRAYYLTIRNFKKTLSSQRTGASFRTSLMLIRRYTNNGDPLDQKTADRQTNRQTDEETAFYKNDKKLKN